MVRPVNQLRVPALTRAVRILEEIATSGYDATLSELARRLDLPKSSALNICEALLSERLLQKDAAGRFKLGIGMAELAAAQLENPPRLRALGFLTHESSNPFFRAEAHAIEASAASLGVALNVLETAKTVEEQQQQLLRLGTRGVDALILDPIDSEAVAQAVAAVKNDGIPVVAVNADAAGADALVATDNVRTGELIARHMAGILNGAGEVVVVGGTRVTGNADRITGFLSALRDFPDIRVAGRVDGDNTFETGRQVGHAVLDLQPDVDAVFTINDPTALGLLQTFELRGSQALILSVDGSAEAVRLLRSDRGIVATAAQDPRGLGQTAIRVAELLFSGSRLPRRTWYLTPTLVVPDNAGSYAAWDA